jgi:predicted metal-dependent phosphoesterase TrpH
VFLQHLAAQQQRRVERAEEMARRLEKNKIPDVLENVLKIANGAALTRTHFARYMVQIGNASSMNTVFKKYLSRGNTGYVPNNWVPMQEAVQWILAAGGTPVLAHPLKYKLNGRWLTRLAEEFSAAGGKAMEVASAQMTPVQKRQVWMLCQKFGLTASAGSDFHQETPWNELGRQLYFTDDVTPVWHDWQLPQPESAQLSS